MCFEYVLTCDTILHTEVSKFENKWKNKFMETEYSNLEELNGFMKNPPGRNYACWKTEQSHSLKKK